MFIPVFEKGLILKQHMLEALRDYPREFIRNLYSEYGDGIITGCQVIELADDRDNPRGRVVE